MNLPTRFLEHLVDGRLDDRIRLVAQQKLQDRDVRSGKLRLAAETTDVERRPVCAHLSRCHLLPLENVPQMAPSVGRQFSVGVGGKCFFDSSLGTIGNRELVTPLSYALRPALVLSGACGAGARPRSRGTSESRAVRSRSASLSPPP